MRTGMESAQRWVENGMMIRQCRSEMDGEARMTTSNATGAAVQCNPMQWKPTRVRVNAATQDKRTQETVEMLHAIIHHRRSMLISHIIHERH